VFLRESSSERPLAARVGEHASETPEHPAVTFISDAHGTASTWTYADLDLEARRVAARLQERYQPGDRALLMCEPGLTYVAAFVGSLYAGMIPVPAYPPSPLVPERGIKRLRTIAADAEASVAITSSFLMPFTGEMELTVGDRSLEWFQCDGSEEGWEDRWKPVAREPSDLNFLQYTSGSTSDPKGVEVTEGNLSAHLSMIYGRLQQAGVSDVRGVSWLPPYHDMGLVGCILVPLRYGLTAVLLGPDLFLRRPLTWLKAISDYRGSVSPAPNFAFDLCVRRTRPEERDQLDLSSWAVAINGAEPVRLATMDRFCEAFAPYGFHRKVFWPSYGLAEATLLASTGSLDRPSAVLAARPGSVEAGAFQPADDGAASLLVSCGQAPEGGEVIVVDPERAEPAADDMVGEVWVRGPHVARGYWKRPEQTAETFAGRLADGSGPYLQTGDLGFLHGGELFVTGRIKDLIVIRGVNHYPQDIEQTVEGAYPGLRPGCGAAFAVGEDTEQLVVVQEVADSMADPEPAYQAIRRAILADHQVEASGIVLVAPRSIPKTSSGKIQRRATRSAFLAGDLDVLHQWTAVPG
jgi:acyl-CoA synthetase (AMP-forming)/AMP-acid ligase II